MDRPNQNAKEYSLYLKISTYTSQDQSHNGGYIAIVAHAKNFLSKTVDFRKQIGRGNSSCNKKTAL